MTNVDKDYHAEYKSWAHDIRINVKCINKDKLSIIEKKIDEAFKEIDEEFKVF